MSFESVFERWLHRKDMEMDKSSAEIEDEPQHHVHDGSRGDEDAGDDEMPVIEREAWREEDMEDMPVLQKMVDLPSVQEESKLQSPPPPPLQITLSLTDTHKKGKQNKHTENFSSHRNECKHINKQTGGEEKSQNRFPIKDKVPQKDKSKTCVQKESDRYHSVHQTKHKYKTAESDLHQKHHHQCHSKSALTELTDLNHGSSPSVPRDTGIDPVLSPDCDLPMEPDSTSEFVVGCAKWQTRRKESDTSGGEASPWQVSPCRTGCAGPTTPSSSSSSEGIVRIEESLAECDSTSMFMTSPSAISPASQGEIEERVCPVLADQEDSASPAHCMCRCRSLPPPADFIPRDHTPVTSTTEPRPTVSAPCTARTQSMSKSWTCLVSRMHSLDDDPAPDLERVAPSLDLMAAPGDVLQGDHDSPPVLTLPEQEAHIKLFRTKGSEHSQSKDIPSETSPQEAPPLISFEAVPPQLSNNNFPKYNDSPPVLSSNDATPNEKYSDCPPVLNTSTDTSDSSRCESPPVLNAHGLACGTKPSRSQKKMHVFTNNIDWKSAVAETVESPPSLTKGDGENKPGIIIKIRTKAAIPRLENATETKPVTKASHIKRKRHTVDNADIFSRLRKRRKTEVDMAAASTSLAIEDQQTYSKTQGIQLKLKANKEKACSLKSSSSTKCKRQRRNTVQLGEDLNISTQHLPQRDRLFVLSSTKLSRIQCLTHELVCTLFPSLESQLSVITPESYHFTEIVKDIILTLQSSDSEEAVRHCEDMRVMFEKLTLNGSGRVPVFSPQVVLCGSPQHSLQDFMDKVCSLLQLLLPDLTVSLSQTLSHSADQLEIFLKKVIMSNKAKSVQ